MRRTCMMALVLVLLLTGCARPGETDGTKTVVTPTDTVTTAVEDGEEPGKTADVTEPAATDIPETQEPTGPQPPTAPPVTEKPKEPPATTPPTAPPVTQPTATVPPETEPPGTEAPETTPPETEPEKPQIDTAAIESYARSYAASLGFVTDTSLGKGNSGYYPPDYRVLARTEDGYGPAAGLVAATKNQLNSRFGTELCDVLVEGAYGVVRMNCQVEYSHTDELGDWYYIYVFYGYTQPIPAPGPVAKKQRAQLSLPIWASEVTLCVVKLHCSEVACGQ